MFDTPILDEAHRIQQLALQHPEALADAAQRLDRNKPSVLYHKLQTEGSAWSRGTEYGSRAVDYAREFCRILVEVGVLPDTHARVCCAGCNDGLEVEEFLRQGYDACGFDLDPEKVRVAQYLHLAVKQGDLESPPFTEGLYDGVFCSHTLEHARDLALACAGIGALLRRGGHLFIVVPLESEFPRGNPSHTSHIASPEKLMEQFLGWGAMQPKVVQNPEPQLLLCLKKPEAPCPPS